MTAYAMDARDMLFLAAAEESDEMLDAIAKGYRPPFTTADGERVWQETFEATLRVSSHDAKSGGVTQ